MSDKHDHSTYGEFSNLGPNDHHSTFLSNFTIDDLKDGGPYRHGMAGNRSSSSHDITTFPRRSTSNHVVNYLNDLYQYFLDKILEFDAVLIDVSNEKFGEHFDDLNDEQKLDTILATHDRHFANDFVNN